MTSKWVYFFSVGNLSFCFRAQKKLWVDKGKWGHDRFVDTFQAPKSTEEIIAEYGYDIRAYDTPPDAPPKSFGRGRYDIIVFYAVESGGMRRCMAGS